MTKRNLRIACTSFALAFLAVGCSSAPTKLEMLSPTAIVLDLPLVQQDELYECGLAAITAECQYYGVELTPEQRSELVRVAAERKGLSGAELRDALEQVGFDVFIFAGARDHSVTGLYTQVDKQRPPLVLLSPEPESNHYCLFLGYDEARGNVVLLDPRRGKILMDYTTFDRTWAAAEQFTLLAVPSDGSIRPTLNTSNSSTEGKP